MDVPERDGSPTTYCMYIDGESVPASTSAVREVRFPYTGETWATVPEGGPADVESAVAAARRCFESDEWQSMTATDRGELLHAFADELETHADELGRIGTLSNGKLHREMRSQAASLPEWYRYYAGLADKVEGRTLPVEEPGTFNFTLREPYGVTGAITSWNSPLMLLTYKLAPAIAAGNTVVAKPSEVTPVGTIRLAEIASEAGFPPGAFNVVTGGGDVGSALTSHADVAKLAFTGGVEAGEAVGSAAGGRAAPVTLELGGKSANVVFADADLDAAVAGVVKGIFAASGQSCIAGSRLLVQGEIHDEFVERLVDRAEDIRLGDPFDEGAQMAPIVTEDQCRSILADVERGIEEGATLRTGGDRRTVGPCDRFVPPTIFTDVDNDMHVASEEIFGPVLSTLSFEDEAEAVEIANDSRFGLAAGVWTGDLQRALRVVPELEAGVVWVNTYRRSSYTTPFGGYKRSGVGREKGQEAIDEYLQTKSVWMDSDPGVDDPFDF
ncbi:MAG: aldehyde dehydrogenase [Haloferacaceae archaeon]